MFNLLRTKPDNNLYYHAIYGSNTKHLHGKYTDITNSLAPYLLYMEQAINAVKNRKISANFKVIEEEKKLQLKKITQKYKIDKKPTISFTLDPGWFKIGNREEFLAKYEEKEKENGKERSDLLSRDKNEKFTLLNLTDGKLIENIESKNLHYIPEDDDNTSLLFIKLPITGARSIEDYENKKINYCETRLFLQKILYPEIKPENIRLDQNNNTIEVVKIDYDEVSSKWELKLEESPDPTNKIRVNYFPIEPSNYTTEKRVELKDIKVFNIVNGNKNPIKIEDINQNDGSIIIKQGNYNKIIIESNGMEYDCYEIKNEYLSKVTGKKGKKETRIKYDEKDLYFVENQDDFTELDDKVVVGNDGNHYEWNIRETAENSVKVQLIEDDDDISDDISRKSNIDYFFDDDAKELLGEPHGVKSYKYLQDNGLYWKIKSYDKEQATISIRIEKEKSYFKTKKELLKLQNKGGRLYLKPDVYQLEMQKEFIETLIYQPLTDYIPLLRLCLSISNTKNEWEAVHTERNKDYQWYILNDTTPGTETQQRFVKKALNTPDFAFLEGPPGSGKTTTILELIIQLIKKKKRILLVASTHVAIDNILQRLMDEKLLGEILPLRIGREENIDERVRIFSSDKILKNDEDDKNDENSIGNLDDLILDSANLVCGTTIGILNHPIFKKKEIGGMPGLYAPNSII